MTIIDSDREIVRRWYGACAGANCDRSEHERAVENMAAEIAAAREAYAAERIEVSLGISPTAQVVTKESHPEVWAKLQPPKVPLATLDAWDHAGRRPGEGSANPAP